MVVLNEAHAEPKFGKPVVAPHAAQMHADVTELRVPLREDALVITGHDRELWPRLEPLYD